MRRAQHQAQRQRRHHRDPDQIADEQRHRGEQHVARIELRVGHSDSRVVLFTPDGHEDRIGSFFNGSFACDDVEKTYAELTARGVEFTGPPKKEPWGTFAIFKDPDGNQFVMGTAR